MKSGMSFEQLVVLLLKQYTFKGAMSILGGWLVSLFMPLAKFIFVVLLLLTFDLITGIWAAHSTKQQLTSRRLSRTISKFIAYTIAILLGHVMELSFMHDTWLKSIPLVYMISFFVCVVEFQSNIENVDRITGINLWSKLSIYFKLFINKKFPNT